MGIKNLVKQSLIARENRKYDKALNARRMTYADWQKAQAKDRVDIPFDLSEYTVLMAACSIPTENAADRIGTYLAQHSGVQIVYGDEDVADAGKTPGCSHMPYFKPDWSPDLLDSCFYIGSMAVVHGSLLQRILEAKPEYKEVLEQSVSDSATLNIMVGRCGKVHAFSAEQENMRRSIIKDCILYAGGYQKRKNSGRNTGEDVIGHIPEILSHCTNRESIESYAETKMTQMSECEKNHLLSIVIPSKDHPELLEKCIRAIVETEKCLDYEIIVVDNGSSTENRAQCEKRLGVLVDEGVQVRYFYRPMEFNFSAMCNLGAEQAKGDLLLFLNDDVELTLENTLAAMAQKALQPYAGAVGLKLFYPDGKRIQHAGITNLPMGPVHKLQFLQDDEACYFFANKGNRNVLAVTAACLMVTKDKFKEAGGFPEQLQVAFNDVALCFGLYEAGYYNVVMNDWYAYHHESLSRGDDESDAKLKRLLREKEQLYALYPQFDGVDPYYSVNLSRAGLDTRIRPAYETGGNMPQPVAGINACTDLSDYRQDNCLMIRVEDCSDEKIIGYAVVLGDDNSCYERKLLLRPVTEGDSASSDADGKLQRTVYCLSLEGQYRPDLAENMPDQVNVGLCGFWLQTDGAQGQNSLPAGRYQIGVAVRNRVTGTKLVNFSNRRIEIK